MDPQNFIAKLQQHMAELKPLKSPTNRKHNIFVHKDLESCSHEFIRIRRVKKHFNHHMKDHMLYKITSIKWAELQWPIGLQQEPRSESAGINDRSIANASCTAIGPPPLKSRSSLQAQVSKTMKIRVPDRG
ncbi:hypothetical protein TNCV_1855811 [Trichonephila clavipes]|nr:hypothetical protein TNCV_1855811 [Trichonephila clavipes]